MCFHTKESILTLLDIQLRRQRKDHKGQNFAMFRCKLYTAHIPHIGLINTLAAPSNFSCQNPGAKVKGEAKKIKILISGRKSAGMFSKNKSKDHIQHPALLK